MCVRACFSRERGARLLQKEKARIHGHLHVPLIMIIVPVLRLLVSSSLTLLAEEPIIIAIRGKYGKGRGGRDNEGTTALDG